MHADGPAMDRCAHGMDVSWCYLCRIDTFGVEPQVLWGILDDELADERRDPGPMVPELEGYLRFLCDELDLRFDPTFTQGEAARVIPSLLTDPANEIAGADPGRARRGDRRWGRRAHLPRCALEDPTADRPSRPAYRLSRGGREPDLR